MSLPLIRSRTVHVRVPATTANLGPGFDALGLALKLYNEIELKILPMTGPDIVEISGEGESSLPRDGHHAVLRAIRNSLPKALCPNALRLRQLNRIPLARGLGSSAAALLSGILAAEGVHATNPRGSKNQNFGFSLSHPPPAPPGRVKRESRRERTSRAPHPDGVKILNLASRLEGHPDNVVPALYGGLCAAFTSSGGNVECASFDLPQDLAGVVCIPNFELPTEKARKALPDFYSRQETVESLGKTAILLHSLEHGRFDRLRLAMDDVLHQPHRAPLVPGMEKAIQAALSAGAYGACLSGAGPSLFAFAPKGPKGIQIGKAMQKAFSLAKVESRFAPLDIDRRGACVKVIMEP